MVDRAIVCKTLIVSYRQGGANLKLAFKPELYERAAHDRGKAGR